MSTQTVNAATSNKAFYGFLEEGNVKQAADMATDFTRIRIRESAFAEKLLPGVKIGNDQLTPQLNTDKNVKLVEREPNSPSAITVPLGATPIQYYFRGDRYPVYFERMFTPKFTKDMSELRTYGMDIRQVLTDNAVLDMDFELDKKFLTAVQSIIGAEDSIVPESGVVQNKKIVDAQGITRDSLYELMKILPRTYARLEVATILVNNITIKDISKFGRDEVGGDLSETMFVNGYQEKKLLNANWVVTNKVDLVAENEFYLFASPEFVGKNFILDDTTMYVDKKGPWLEWFAYTERGMTIGNPMSVGRGNIALA